MGRIMGKRRPSGVAALAVAAFGLCGCTATVDNFSDRVVNFNQQSAQAHNQELLLNIVRASRNEPLEITSLRDVQGTATVTGSANLNIPLVQSGGFSTGINPILLQTGTAISGGPIFSLDVLNTQEFYRGFLAPITTQTLDYYMHQGIPRGVLFYLMMRQIVISQGGRSIAVLNVANPAASPQAARNARYFREIVADLVYNNVITEQISTDVSIGPDLSPEDVKSVPALVGALSAGLQVTQVSTKPEHYRLQKSISSYRFCIGPSATRGDATAADMAAADAVAAGDRCGASQKEREGLSRALGGEPASEAYSLAVHSLSGSATVKSLPAGQAGNQPRSLYAILPELLPGFDATKPFQFEFVTRSTQSIIQFLGEITQTQITAAAGSESITVPIWSGASGQGDESLDTGQIGYEPLFVVDSGSGPKAMVSVDFRGGRYSIAEDRSHSGNSALVLALVEQLMALNKSARDLPSSSYLTVTH